MSRRRPRFGMSVALLLGALSPGCNNIDRFDTSNGDVYCGQIVDGRFVRQGFPRQMQMALTLDLQHLQSVAGTVTTFDTADGPCTPGALFTHASLRVPKEVLADPLSTLEFGEAREYNFLAWVDSNCAGTLLAVVSLMKNNDVEVRLLEPASASSSPGPGFGVFQLSRQKECGS